jgi:superoxide reductase
MKEFGDLFHTADWKTEKHVPVIECADQVTFGELLPVKVTVGKEVTHPNTTEHHIRWISIYFHAEGDKFPCQIGHFAFSAHGESVEGANQGPIYTNPEVTASVKVMRSGTIFTTAFCNIHGLWRSEKEIKVA